MKKRFNFREHWNVIEKFICYFALAVVVVSQIVSLVFPSMPSIDDKVTMCILGSALIMIFENVNSTKEMLAKKSKAGFSKHFNDGLIEACKKSKSIKSLDIICHTSKTYFHSINDLGVTIDHMRLLVCRPRYNSTKHYPAQDALEEFNSTRDNSIKLWKDLHNRGIIKNLEIRYYEFDPTFHFAIIDKQYIHYGMYKLQRHYIGYQLFPLYTLNAKESPFNEAQLEDLSGFFDHIYENWSYSDSEVEAETLSGATNK